jgi:hypothetical protein
MKLIAKKPPVLRGPKIYIQYDVLQLIRPSIQR